MTKTSISNEVFNFSARYAAELKTILVFKFRDPRKTMQQNHHIVSDKLQFQMYCFIFVHVSLFAI